MHKSIEYINNEGVQLFLKGKFEEAKLKYQEVLTINPKYATALNNLGMVALQQKEYNIAAKYFNGAIKEADKATYFLNLGHAFVNLNEFAEAKRNYVKAIEKAPNELMAHVSLASLYQKQRNFKESVIVWEYVVTNLSTEVKFKLHLAKDYIKLEEYSNALSVLYDASKQEENIETVWYYTALVHFNNKNFGLAEKAIKKAIAIQSYNLTFKNLYAVIHLGQSNLEDAVLLWNEILTLEPDNHKIRIDKAVALLAHKKLKNALEELNLVLRKEQIGKAIYYKALVLLESGYKKEAILELEQLSNLKSDFSEEAITLLTTINNHD